MRRGRVVHVNEAVESGTVVGLVAARSKRWGAWGCAAVLGLAAVVVAPAQEAAPAVRAKRFLAGRTEQSGASAAVALDAARRQHLALVDAQPVAGRERANALAGPRISPLNAAWQAVGPMQVVSQSYGLVTGRVTSVAIDPSDATGNTVYLGTTGGGVWKSMNAAGPPASVAFAPLTDMLPVFSANAGTAALPSLSIGSVSVAQGVVLAGTGDPNDATDSYYGQGILRSADGGVTWTLAQGSNDGLAGHHSFVGRGVAGFAWSSAIPNLVVAALSQSAEGVVVNSPDATHSVMGLYYSNDAGNTWAMATIEDGSQVVQQPQPGATAGNAVTSVVWNQARQRFYAAVRFHGYYESLDGVTWTRLAHQPGAGLTTANCPVVTSSACPIFRGALAVQPATGDTFALTVDRNNQDQGLWQDVCALSGGGCGASPIGFGTKLASGPLEVGSGISGQSTAIAQADYNLALAAVGTGTGPSTDTTLFVDTEDLYRCSIAAGCVLRNTTNAVNGCAAPAKVSPAEHAIAALAGAGTGGTLPLVYVGNDGGVWRSLDGVNQQQTPCSPDDATHFQNLNGGLGSLAEVVGFAQDPANVGTLIAGLGANGTAATGGATTGAAWPQIAAGEGGMVAIDQATPRNWYASTAAGVNLHYCGNGSACGAADFTGAPTLGYAQVQDDASLIDPPWLLDPAMASDALIGTCRVWRGSSQSGAAWPGGSAISTMLGGSVSGVCSATSAMVRSLAAGGPASGAVSAQNAGSSVLYAGMAGGLDGGGSFAGHVFANYAAGSAGASTVWMDVAKSAVTNDVADAGVFNPGGFDISAVAVDVHDASGMTVYATVMGFAGNGVNAPHVYRSADGGMHWTNISGNLPNAPANGVSVDPNDANTVYVAMDTGVYVTTQVTTCGMASVNCWSVYGAGLPNAPVVGLQAGAGLAAGDGRLGELRVATYGRGIWEIPLLTAITQAVPVMTLSPVSLTFGTQAVVTASAAQTITVTNSGNAPLTVSQIITSGDFTETDNCVGVSGGIAAGAACAVQVSFLPTVTGTRSGGLTVYGNVAGGQATAILSGTGTPPAAIVLNPISVTYSGTNVGSVSAAQNITISNTGGLTATLQTPMVTGEFSITANTCGATLGSGVGCTVSVGFGPTASGTRTGSLSVTDSAGTQTASLSGLGLLPATDALSPASLNFAGQQLNTASGTQQVTLTNSGDAALTLLAAQITTGDFTVVNSCGNSLSGHSACSMLVSFVPKNVGGEAGVLTVSDEYRNQAVTLSGTGVAPAGVTLSPLPGLTFATTGVGLTATGQTLTLTNNGGMPLLIQSMGITGDFALSAGSNTCGASVAVGGQCSVQVVFAPTAGGARTGSVTLVDNAGTSPQSLQLAGTGVDFALSANGSTTQTIAAGAQAVYPLLLTSAAAAPGTVAFTCTGAPAYSTCVVTPSSAALGGTSTITVTVATDIAELRMPFLPGQRPGFWLAGLLPLGLLTLRRKSRLRRFGGVVLLGCALMVTGCAASRLIPQTTTGGGGASSSTTPSGTYNLVVSGASAGLSRSVGLTLIVQ
jgi:hypothetical protein